MPESTNCAASLTDYAATLTEYAEKELAAIDLKPETKKAITDTIKWIADNDFEFELASVGILEMIGKILNLKPLSPLTGEPKEWDNPDEYGICLNVRCPSVIRRSDGVIIDMDAAMVSADGGLTWSSAMCIITDSFPYTPSTFPSKRYIENKKYGNTVDITDNPERITSLRRQCESELRRNFNDKEI